MATTINTYLARVKLLTAPTLEALEKAVNDYIHTMYESGQDIPTLKSLNSDGVQWDWMKPCYYQKLYYTCDAAVDLDADNTEDNE